MATRTARAVVATLCSASVAVASAADAAAQGPPAPPAAPSATISIRAKRVEYYGDVGIIMARGDVRVTQPDGTQVEGDVFAMHLGLRRFLVVGHVRLHTHDGVLSGAGYADFLVFKRQYFVPLDPEADRWTFFDYDYAHPSKGRVMPGDAFFVPNVAGVHPYIVARSVTVHAGTYARFAPATFVLFDGALWTPPLPPYTYNYSPNQNFAVNGLSGASFDTPYNLAGSPNSLSALHYRYGPQPLASYAAVEQHFVSSRGYVVFSLNPATQPQKQWNTLAYQRLSSKSAVALDAQLFTYQYGLTQPLASSGFGDVLFTQGLRRSYVRLDLTQEYSSLLAQPALGYYGNPSHPWIPNHPFTAGVSWSGFDERLARTGLSYILHSGYASQHDAYGINGTDQQQAASYYAGGSLFTPVYPGPFGTGLAGSYTLNQAWLSFPNIVQTQNFTATASRRVTRSLTLIASSVIDSAWAQNTHSLITANQATGLVPLPSSGNGLPFVLGGFLRATNRSYGLTAALAPTPNFQLTLAYANQYFSPNQVPLVSGPPRNSLSGDVRFRITRVLFLDVQRAYSFNWGGQPWSPHFNILVTSQ